MCSVDVRDKKGCRLFDAVVLESVLVYTVWSTLLVWMVEEEGATPGTWLLERKIFMEKDL